MIKRLNEVYNEAIILYNSNCLKFKLQKFSEPTNDRFTLSKIDLLSLDLMKKCFNDIINLSDYSMLEFYLCRMAIFYSYNKDNSFELMSKKRKDYGITPILITGQIGIVVRIISKLCRIINLQNKKENFESIEDNRMDIFNYSIIGLQMMRGDFKNEH